MITSYAHTRTCDLYGTDTKKPKSHKLVKSRTEISVDILQLSLVTGPLRASDRTGPNGSIEKKKIISRIYYGSKLNLATIYLLSNGLLKVFCTRCELRATNRFRSMFRLSCCLASIFNVGTFGGRFTGFGIFRGLPGSGDAELSIDINTSNTMTATMQTLVIFVYK